MPEYLPRLRGQLPEPAGGERQGRGYWTMPSPLDESIESLYS
jgi:hypothetical protein